MNTLAKKVLFIDLTNKKSDVKSFPDLVPYIGGVGVGLKLMESFFDPASDPLVLSIGPFNGYFPFASKACLVLSNDGVIEDLYIGGSLASRLKFTGFDAVVISGTSAEPVILDIVDDRVLFQPHDIDSNTLGLPGKRSLIRFGMTKLLLDDYFSTPESFLEKKFVQKNLAALVLTGTKTFDIPDMVRYETIFNTIMDRRDKMLIKPNSFPSCVGCPMGCEKSRFGELGGNVLLHSLVACHFADNIYSDIAIVFSGLNALGYSYTHEDIEKVPELVSKVLRNF